MEWHRQEVAQARSCEQGLQTRSHLPEFWSPGPQTLESDGPVHDPALISHSWWENVWELPKHQHALDASSVGRGFQHLHHRLVGGRYAPELSTLPCRKCMLQYITLPLFLCFKVPCEEPKKAMNFSSKTMWLLILELAPKEKTNQTWSAIWFICFITRFKCPHVQCLVPLWC